MVIENVTLIWGGAAIITGMIAWAMNVNRHSHELVAESKAINVTSLRRQSEEAPEGADPVRPEGHRAARAAHKHARVRVAHWHFFPVLTAGIAFFCAAMAAYTIFNP